VTDVDNTLFDWVEMWSSGFEILLRDLVEFLDLDENTIKRSIRRANQILGTSECSEVMFHLDIIDDVKRNQRSNELREMSARFQSAKDAATHLYAGVLATLNCLRTSGFRIVCLTESVRPYAEARAVHLGLDGLADLLVCPKFDLTEGFASGMGISLKRTPVMTLRKNLRKPDPRVLLCVAERFDVPISNIVYVGDSLFKDITMANSAGARGFWAKYGDAAASSKYNTLREVSHWPDGDILAEIELGFVQPRAEHVLSGGFQDIIEGL